jgi:hypothetical protein
MPFFAQLSAELGNGELCAAARAPAPLAPATALAALQACALAGGDPAREIAFAAAAFRALPAADLARLDAALLGEVLSSDALVLDSEDALLDIVARRAESDAEDFWLFEYVRLEFLSSAAVSRFVELARRFTDRMSAPIWDAVERRLVLAVPPPPGRRPPAFAQFAYSRHAPLCGIIRNLESEDGRNACEAGAIRVFASAEPRPAAQARMIVDFGDRESRFLSESTGRGWIAVDFKDRTVLPSHYVLRSHLAPFLMSWVFEGSSDGEVWTQLDKQKGSTRLASPYVIAAFPIAKPVLCRYFRLRQTGDSHNPGHHGDFFALSALELFGELHGGTSSE